MRYIFLILLIAGCAPTVTAYSGDTVTLEYDPVLSSREAADQKAEDICRRDGKHAEHLFTELSMITLLNHGTYKCVTPSQG